MYQTIVTIVVFLLWVCHGWILYTIDQFCQHRFGHPPRNELESATSTTQSSQEEGRPRHDQKIDLVSQPEKQSAILNSDCSHSCTNTENVKIHHSTATDNGIEEYVGMLEAEHAEMRHEIFLFQQKFQQLSFIITGLEETQYENEELRREIASLRARAHEQEKHHQIAETEKYENKIALITAELHQVTEEKLSQTFALDSAMDTINAKVNLLDTLETELQDLIIKLQEQSSVRKENAELKEQVAYLREIESKLMNDKDILESKLHSLDSEIRIIMDAKEAAEQSALQAEVLADEQLKTMERLNFDLDLANNFIDQRGCIIDQLHNELSKLHKLNAVLDKQNKEMKIVDAQNEELKKKMDLDLLTQIRTLSETNSQLRTEIQFANAQIVSLRQTVIEKERESSEFRKETEILRAESERTMGSCKAASFSPDQAAKSVEQQRTSTMQSLLSEFDPLTNDIPVRFPRSNWVSDFDEIDPLKVEIHELNARVRILEQLNETLTSRMEEDMMVEEELRQTIEELAEQNHLLVRLVPTNPAQLPDRATTQQESALYEALDSSVQPAWYEKKVVEEEEISESGSRIHMNDNFVEKKNGSRFKRWLDKREFGKQATQDNDVVKLMQGTAKVMIQKAKKLKEKSVKICTKMHNNLSLR